MEGFLMAQLEVGISINFSPEGEERFGPAANALADALKAIGLDASVAVRPKYDERDRLMIRVGKKP